MRPAATTRHEAVLLASADGRSGGDPGGLRRQTRGVRVIVLLGIDGSGKTTAATALAADERAAGRPVIVVRNRSGRRWLLRFAYRLGLGLPVRWADRVETVVRTVNVLAAHARTARRVRTVIMDRHLACQLVLRKVRDLPTGRVLPSLSARLLSTATVVVLDVEADTAQARILARGEDHESLGYLRAARAAYLDLARSQGWLVVDATGPTETILAQLDTPTASQGRFSRGSAHRTRSGPGRTAAPDP